MEQLSVVTVHGVNHVRLSDRDARQRRHLFVLSSHPLLSHPRVTHTAVSDVQLARVLIMVTPSH